MPGLVRCSAAASVAAPSVVAVAETEGAKFGKAKIENLGVAALGHKDVRGFDVAMDDAFGMSRVKGVGHFDGNVQNALQLHRASDNVVLQRHAIKVFHGDERFGIVFTDIVNRADVGMV